MTLQPRLISSAWQRLLCLAKAQLRRDCSVSTRQHISHSIPRLQDSKDTWDPNNITTAKYYGLSTFANLPYVHGLAPEGQPVEPYDIAILGAPFDTGTTGRSGARDGPTAVRHASQRIHPEFNTSIYTQRNALSSWARIVDTGDVPLTPHDNILALDQLSQAHQILTSRPAASHTHRIPRVITLGGDHTTTLPALRTLRPIWGPLTLIHLDAHIDTWTPASLGASTIYSSINHGTVFHHAAAEGLLSPKGSTHAGIRCALSSPQDMEHDRECGFTTITARDIDSLGVAGVVRRILDSVGGRKAYVSVDVDVLDPAFAPGTGTPEPGGWSVREVLGVLDGLEGVEVVGADVVEVAPAYDSRGQITGLAAAEVVKSLVGLMVAKPVTP
ncbi:arginase [Myriangium duriaei CBS 260.36]|uniref:Arginase n=1 Tax=Myriangium duriaei CBS 260.36 TaxID=1168546 RepID=A0A9P4J5R0_9PEZI|nr:arginase [Myriangium duriaei CBS 260.36]